MKAAARDKDGREPFCFEDILRLLPLL